MLGTPNGVNLLGAAFLAVGLAGIAVFSVALLSWLTTSNTSPLAALFALAWSCTYFVIAVLTWRRSRFAAPAFLAAMGFVVLLLWFILPGHELLLLLPLFVVNFFLAFLGYQYLRRVGEPAA
jgi:hypothetical protein